MSGVWGCTQAKRSHIVKFVQTPRPLIALEEYNADDRQISTVVRCRTVRLQQQIIADTEVIDEIGLENEKFMQVCGDAVGS